MLGHFAQGILGLCVYNPSSSSGDGTCCRPILGTLSPANDDAPNRTSARLREGSHRAPGSAPDYAADHSANNAAYHSASCRILC